MQFELTNRENISHNSLVIDYNSYTVAYNGKNYGTIPIKEFELLSLLASKPGRIFTRSEIINAVWGREVIVIDRTIDVHIRKLRIRFGDDFITTIKARGYGLNDKIK